MTETPSFGDKVTGKKQVLETDVQTLAALRDQLALALSILEQNTDRITAWLKENRNDIIIARHRVSRAIASGDDTAVRLAIFSIGKVPVRYEIAGFILADGELINQAKAVFGEKHEVIKDLEKITPGLPARLIEAPPVIDMSEEMSASIAATSQSAFMPPPPARTSANKENPLSGWFKGKAEREAEEAEAAHQKMLGQWRQLHRDLLGLQSDRHYYVDSFMDWIGENLSPSDPDQNFAALMTRYQHPAYVLEHAQNDYNQAEQGRSRQLMEDASAYARVAGLLDRQDIVGFGREMATLFPRPDTPDAANLRELLLKDFEASSFADLVLDYAQKPEDRLYLFKCAAAFESRLTLKGRHAVDSVFQRILDEVTAAQNPLPPEALAITLDKLNTPTGELLEKFSAFNVVMQRFGDDDTTLTRTLAALTGNKTSAGQFVTLRRAIINQDHVTVAAALAAINTTEEGHAVRALGHLCMPNESLIDGLLKASQYNITPLVPLLARVIDLGMSDELDVSNKQNGMATTAVLTLNLILNRSLFKQLDKTTPHALAVLMRAAQLHTNPEAMKVWRESISGANGFIARLANDTRIDAKTRLAHIATLLAPFPSPFIKAALILDAANSLSSAGDEGALLLRDAARSLAGDTLVFNAREFFTNAQHIANIWYDQQGSGTLYYTLGGSTQTFKTGVSAEEAEAIFTLLADRHGFLREHMGLFNPALADGFEHNDKDSRISWDMHVAPLNIDAATRKKLLTLPNLIHGTVDNGNGRQEISLHPRSVLALLPYDGKWLIIDRNGTNQLADSLKLPLNTGGLQPLGGGFVNPTAASLLMRHDDEQAIDLRIENAFFTQLLNSLQAHPTLSHHAVDGQYLRLSTADKAEWAALKKDMAATQTLLSPGGDLSHLSFNLANLGFIAFDLHSASPALLHSQQSKGMTARIDIDQDLIGDLHDGLTKAAAKNESLLVVPHQDGETSVIVDINQIQNIYYNTADKRLIIITDHDTLPLPMAASAAIPLLARLNKDSDLTSVSTRSQGKDLIRLDRATKLSFDKGQTTATALIGNRQIELTFTEKEFADWAADMVRAGATTPATTTAVKDIVAFLATCDQPLKGVTGLPTPYQGQDTAAHMDRVLQPVLVKKTKAQEDNDTDFIKEAKNLYENKITNTEIYKKNSYMTYHHPKR